MNKKQIRLTESDLKQIVKESVNKILSEAYGTPPQKDIIMANDYVDATYPGVGACGNGSLTTDDDYNNISPEIREIALAFKKIYETTRLLRTGLYMDETGFVPNKKYNRVGPQPRTKNSKALSGIDSYLLALDKVADKGREILSRMVYRMVQNMGLNPEDEPWTD